MIFFIEVVLSGLMAGVMYSLVALGFVLIFKASGIFNFAQGVMALFAALTLVGLMEKFGFPIWLAIIGTIAVMIALAWADRARDAAPAGQPGADYPVHGNHRSRLRARGHGRYPVGLRCQGARSSAFRRVPLTGCWIPLIFISKNWKCSPPRPPQSWSPFLAIFFQKTRIGRALRAVADDHQAALSVGISLHTIWVIVWSVAGIVALVAGIMWGSKSGVQFSLSLIALKALPVLILGGFTSVPGAIIGGMIIGVGEKVAEVYLGPIVGGAIENWFAYMLALAQGLFLLFRPQGRCLANAS